MNDRRQTDRVTTSVIYFQVLARLALGCWFFCSLFHCYRSAFIPAALSSFMLTPDQERGTTKNAGGILTSCRRKQRKTKIDSFGRSGRSHKDTGRPQNDKSNEQSVKKKETKERKKRKKKQEDASKKYSQSSSRIEKT